MNEATRVIVGSVGGGVTLALLVSWGGTWGAYAAYAIMVAYAAFAIWYWTR